MFGFRYFSADSASGDKVRGGAGMSIRFCPDRRVENNGITLGDI